MVEMNEDPKHPRMMPYIDPSDILHIDVGIPGYQVPVQNAVLRLKPALMSEPVQQELCDEGPYSFDMEKSSQFVQVWHCASCDAEVKVSVPHFIHHKPQQENDGPHIGEAAAIYAFAAHLLMRDQPIVISRNHATMGELGELIGEFCRLNGWKMEDENWYEKLQARSEVGSDNLTDNHTY